MVIKLIHRVSGAKSYSPGDVIQLSKDEEKRLIKLGIASKHDGEVIANDPVVSNEGGIEELTEEEFNELAKKLNDAGNKEPLIAAAVAVGVELSDEDKKKKETAIERIIEQGFDEEVLEELSKGE